MRLALLLFAALCYGQTQLTLSAPPAPPVQSAGGSVIGVRGQTPVYYWVVAIYPSGKAVPLGPVAVINTVGSVNFNSSNYVALSWTAMVGATGYDVIRADTTSFPANPTCASCARVLNTSATSYIDQGASGSAYPSGAAPASAANTTIFINNRDLDQPYITIQTNYGGTTYVSAWPQYVLADPVGTACTSGAFPLRYLIGTTKQYACSSGIWTLMSGSGGGGGLGECGGTGILVQLTSTTTVCRTLTAGTGISISNGTGVSGNPTITSTITQGLTDCSNTTNGMVSRTAANATICRTLTAGTGISISNGDGVSGNPTVTSTVTQGVPNPGANGMVACTGTACSTSATRTITAGAGISISNGDGVSGNPTITNTGTASVTGLADCKVSISGAVATIASPCNYSAGGIVKTLASDATFTLSGTNASSTAYFYHAADGTLTADESTVATGTCNAFCTAGTTGGFPSQSTPIATAAFTNNSFTSVTDLRAAFSGKTVLPGTCLTSAIDSNGQQTLTPDTTNCLQTIGGTQNSTNNSAVIASGSTTAYTCNPAVPYTQQADNTIVTCKFDLSNTGAAPTLSVSSLTAKVMYKRNGTSAPAQIAAGELRTVTPYTFTYDSSLNSAAGGWITDIGGGGSSSAITPAFWFPFGGWGTSGTGRQVTASANKTIFSAFVPPISVTVSKVSFWTSTGSGTCGGTCGAKVGIYDSAGTTILAQTAALTSGGSPNINTAAALQASFTGAVTLTAGTTYWLAITTDSTAMAVYGPSGSGLIEGMAAAYLSTGAVGYGNSGSGSGASVILPSAVGTVTQDGTLELYYVLGN